MTGMRIKEREQTAMRPCNCGIRPDAEPGRESDSGFLESEPDAEDDSPTGNGSMPSAERSHFVNRFLNFVGWMVPTAILALIPKCPACVAGYAVIGTSVGFSLSRFAQLRLAIIVLCVVSLFYLGTKSVVYVVTRIALKRHP
jgi:hypothetical protein